MCQSHDELVSKRTRDVQDAICLLSELHSQHLAISVEELVSSGADPTVDYCGSRRDIVRSPSVSAMLQN